MMMRHLVLLAVGGIYFLKKKIVPITSCTIYLQSVVFILLNTCTVLIKQRGGVLTLRTACCWECCVYVREYIVNSGCCDLKIDSAAASCGRIGNYRISCCLRELTGKLRIMLNGGAHASAKTHKFILQ
jgi:hypothetical protein